MRPEIGPAPASGGTRRGEGVAPAGRLPNFLIIGAPKAGTSSLYYYLAQHPDIFLTRPKEPTFFAFEGERPDFRGPGDEQWLANLVTDLEAYRALFRGVTHETARGEASTEYLYSPRAPERIAHHVSHVRMIAVLRDPAERALSNYLHMVRDGREPAPSLGAALDDEPRRLRAGWSGTWDYTGRGFYGRQLARYLARFDRAQLRIYLQEELDTEPLRVVRDIYGFLGVDPAFRPDVSVRVNPGGIPRNGLLHRVLTRRVSIGRSLDMGPAGAIWRRLLTLQTRNLERPTLDPATRRRLVDLYRADILELQAMLGRDLSTWLRC